MQEHDDEILEDPWHAPLLIIYYVSITIGWIYSLGKAKNLIFAMYSVLTKQYKTKRGVLPGSIAGTGDGRKKYVDDCTNKDEMSLISNCYADKPSLPHVTVQICTYNEGGVIRDTVACACSLKWPKNKLTIQVCDDSTHRESIDILEEIVRKWQAQGVDIERKTRKTRVGYKAGSLRHHFHSIVGDFVAHFDADHRPEPNFLQNVMPYFFDAQGNPKENVGLVQTPWGYYNTHSNLLTECGTWLASCYSCPQFLRKSTWFN